MKSLFIVGILITFNAIASQTGLIEEQVYITGVKKDLVKLIQKHPELTMDHMDGLGFELYGPKGTKKWLRSIGVVFNEHISHQHKSSEIDLAGYPKFSQVERNLKSLVKLNPKIAKLISIGKSVEGRDLWVVKISDNVEKDEVEPEFKYISSMHGNEITGRALTQFLIKDLIEGYNKDQKITDLINNTEIYIMPSMNPDGSERKRRANANSYDLNRNFPDWVNGDLNSSQSRQPETIALMEFQRNRQFSFSANFHGGAVVVNYPWDSTHKRHPLDGLVKELSLGYADLNPEMRNSRHFQGGVTNGADWYVLHGGMQDWSYFWHNDLQVTVELSDKKWPRYSEIPSFYKDNKDSMIRFIENAHQGGGFKIVKNKNTGGRVTITQKFTNNTTKSIGSYGFKDSEFFKVLEVGQYEFKIQPQGSAEEKIIEVSVDKEINKNGNFIQI